MRRITAILAAGGLALAACGGGAGSELVSNAGADFEVTVGEAPVFDGCSSSGEITNYQWTIVEAPASQPDANGKELRTVMSNCEFELENAMTIDDVGEWTIRLVITDGETEAVDQVVVTVNQ